MSIMIFWLGLAAASVAFLSAHWIRNFFSNKQSSSIYYTDLAVEALHDLYKKGALSREEYDEMRKNFA